MGPHAGLLKIKWPISITEYEWVLSSSSKRFAMITRLNNAATVVPSDFSGTFIERRHDAQVVEYDMHPVMLILPERVDDTEAEMHIVLEGRITIDKTHFSEHTNSGRSPLVHRSGIFASRTTMGYCSMSSAQVTT